MKRVRFRKSMMGRGRYTARPSNPDAPFDVDAFSIFLQYLTNEELFKVERDENLSDLEKSMVAEERRKRGLPDLSTFVKSDRKHKRDDDDDKPGPKKTKMPFSLGQNTKRKLLFS